MPERAVLIAVVLGGSGVVALIALPRARAALGSGLLGLTFLAILRLVRFLVWLDSRKDRRGDVDLGIVVWDGPVLDAGSRDASPAEAPVPGCGEATLLDGLTDDSDWPLGHSACAFTHYRWDSDILGFSDDDAFDIARHPDKAATRRERAAEWKGFGFDDPAIYARYRQQEPLGRVLARTARCLYCACRLHMGQTRERSNPEDEEQLWAFHVGICPECGWWLVEERNEVFPVMGPYGTTFKHAYAVLRRYDPLALDTPLGLAREYLARNPHKLARFDPFRFEDLLADCIRDSQGSGEIVKLGGRGDGGIDIKAISAAGETTLTQVKRRADFTKREGVSVIRELHGVMLREGVPRGMVITTAHQYSRQALEEAECAGRNLEHYSMELLSLQDVIDLLGTPPAASTAPWQDFGIQIDRPASGWKVSRDWIDLTALPASIAKGTTAS